MRCPTLAELPPPPPGRRGWPWTEESPPLPDAMPGGRPWPRVSIVTPSYNQAQFLEETIRSVLLQGYPDLEYIICDGGSTDGSVEIIRKYAPWLAWWCSEQDAGQADAINKGWSRATGDVLAWLNSDDLYTCGALAAVGQRTACSPAVSVFYGDGMEFQALGQPAQPVRTRRFTLLDLLRYNQLFQPSVFVRPSSLDAVGMLDVELHYAMDYDLWIRPALAGIHFEHIPRVLSLFRRHATSKTVSQAEAMGLEALQVRVRAISAHPQLAYAQRRIVAHGDLDLAYYRRSALNIPGVRAAVGQAVRLDPTVVLTPRFGKLLPTMLFGGRIGTAVRQLQQATKSTIRRVRHTIASG